MRTRTMTSLVAITAFAWIASSTPVVGRSTEYRAGGIAFDWCRMFTFDYGAWVPMCSLDVWTDGVPANLVVGEAWSVDPSSPIQPKWSPDGSRIAFLRPGTYPPEIYVVHVGDLRVVNVTNHPAIDSAPAWSPDGTRIAFLSDRSGATELYSVNHDGTNLVSVTNAIGFTGQFAWSPTANTLAIVRQVAGAITLDRINGDGSNHVQLTSGEGFTGEFVWSPAGSAIAITRQVQGVRDLYRMNSDGSNLRLTAGGEITGGFTWASARAERLLRLHRGSPHRGSGRGRLFLNDEGNPVYEIDTSPNWRNTYFSPDTGKSVSDPGTGSLMSVYSPDGKAVVTVDGLFTLVHVPGREPLLIDLGRFMFTAEVVGIDANGVPLTDPPVEVLFDSSATRGSVLAACEALAPEPAPRPARAIRVSWIPER
jgi:hypothetical protein